MSDPSARYRILRRLGQGGMAEVFEAELAGQLGFVRKVAIKRMLPDAAADKAMAQRFLDEARIASRLHHANIVSVLDVGLLDGMPFQVLELIDGIDVTQLQSRSGRVLPLEVALIIANDVAHALDHAHNARGPAGELLGIVHRDVKPANVLVSWGGDVKLTDFGIAFANDRVTHTETGLVPGTRGYIAPEQRTRGEIDGRTDVFALGVTLHALLSGYTPLQDITVEIALLEGEALPLDPALPADVRAVIERAVTPSRLDRFTAAQLADALGSLLAPRLSREPRGYLQQFLAPLRQEPRAAGALDQLLGLDVVLSAAAVGDDPARYELRPTVLAKPAPTPVQASHDVGRAATIPEATLPPVGPRSGRTVAMIAVLGLGAVGAGVVAQQLGSKPATQQIAPADATVATVVPDAAVVAVADAADIAVVVSPPTPDAGVTIAKRPVRVRADAGIAKTQERPPTPAPAGTGYVQVVGEDNIGARIVVDGRDAGYAPSKLEVARGTHELVVVRKDGTRLRATIDVTEYHTLQRPLRPTL